MRIEEMEAGMRLNALIEEHVMKQCPHPESEMKYYCVEDGNGADTGYTCGRCGVDLYGKRCPNYSGDIAAAWQVVEKMVSHIGYENQGCDWRGPLFKPTNRHLTTEGYPLGTAFWYVHVSERDGIYQLVCADTPALAICRAALKAAGITEVPDNG